jgi:hypothetical protein
MKLTGRMRYLCNGRWMETRYSMTAMSYVILGGYPYELEGRDY